MQIYGKGGGAGNRKERGRGSALNKFFFFVAPFSSRLEQPAGEEKKKVVDRPSAIENIATIARYQEFPRDQASGDCTPPSEAGRLSGLIGA